MHFMRLLRTRKASALLLVGVLTLTIVSIGEISRVYMIRPDGVKLRRRDGSTITFDMPWKTGIAAPATDVKIKAVSPVFGQLLNGVTNVADALLKGGVDVTNNVIGEGSDVLSMALKGEDTPALISSILEEVNRVVSQATSVVGEVVEAATSIVGAVLSDAVSPSNVGALSGLKPANNTASATSTPLGSMSSKNTSQPLSSTAFNGTAVPSIIQTSSSVVPSMAPSCPPMTAASCPGPQTVTCTETWHSTHYAETATLFSFMSVVTVTCTETVSMCAGSPHLTPNNFTMLSQSPGMVACSNGQLAKREEGCPSVLMNNTTMPNSHPAYSLKVPPHPCPGSGYACSECSNGWFCPPVHTSAQQCPCGMGWACGDCKGGWYCPQPPTQTGDLGSLALPSKTSVSPIIASGPALSMMATLTESVTSLEKGMSSTSPGAGMIVCIDGSIVMPADKCVNGVLSALTSLLPSTTMSAPGISQITSAPANAGKNILQSLEIEVTGTLTNIDGLSGSLLSTALPTTASLVNSVTENLPAALPTNVNLVNNIVPIVAAAASDVAGNLPVGMPSSTNNLAGNALPSLASNGNPLSNNIVPGIIKAVKNQESTVPGALDTTINGKPTILPIVATTINGVPTIAYHGNDVGKGKVTDKLARTTAEV